MIRSLLYVNQTINILLCLDKGENERVNNVITGSCVALVTPMTIGGAIDWVALDGLIEWHINEGTDAIVALGTTGENAVLTREERREVLERIILKVKNRVSVIAGTGTNSTQESVHLTAEAKALGADACLLVVPYYNRPGQEGLYQHFRSIADAVSIPQILYNVPGRTVTDLLPETVSRLAGHQHIVGIKEATGDLGRAKFIIDSVVDEDFVVYSGDDLTAVGLMLLGGKGIISVVANVAPKAVHDLCQAALAGDNAKAKAIDKKLSELNSALFVEANPIPVKWALTEMGKIQNGIRLPLTPLDVSLQPSVRHAMNAAGLTAAESI